MKAYLVNSPVRHDGERFAPGSVLELSDADARPLLERGRIERMRARATEATASEQDAPPPAPKAAAPKPKKAKTEE